MEQHIFGVTEVNHLVKLLLDNEPMLVKFLQTSNAWFPRLSQFDKSTLVRAEQFWNAASPIEVQFDRSPTLVRAEQPSNVRSAIVVQFDRSTTLVRAEQYRNA